LDHWYNPYDPASGLTCSAGVCTTTALELYSGQFQWWVQAYINPPGAYTQWSATTTFTVNTVAPTQFTPIGTTSSAPTYQWGRVKGAEWYYLWVSHESMGYVHDQWFSSASICTDMLCSVSVATPTNNYTAGVNCWWVQAYSTGGSYSPWGAEQQFIYVTPTATPSATFTPTHTSTPTSWTCIVDFRTGQHEYVNRNPVTLVSHT